GEMAAITTELLGCGRSLADALGEELSAVLLGTHPDGTAQEAISYGADKVYVVDDQLLDDYQADSYLAAMEAVVKTAPPKILLIGQTAIGRDLTPRLAFRLESAATMDCVALDLDPDSQRLLSTKPVYGGNAQAVFTSESDPQIASIRAKAMSPLEPDPSKEGQVVSVDAGLDPSVVRTRLLERVVEEVEGVKLEDAPVIATGGRGLDGPESFEQLRVLADLLKGAVGATRPVCDNGWMPETYQVGLTGKIVTPDVYIAVAVSGATQHMAGCSGARTIVAINRDPHANIFREAHYGVVGDWKTVLPAFTEKIRELVSD
ncbi:MAG: electron transfer flavoprotein subunit alpha/FixB family protein, partial [Gammaproteobacteria bacterium]